LKVLRSRCFLAARQFCAACHSVHRIQLYESSRPAAPLRHEHARDRPTRRSTAGGRIVATLTSTPDAVLGRRLRERDHSAWEELYAAHGPQLRAFALRLARDPHEADDLVQETFVRALPRLDKLDLDEVALRPYLFTTLRNTFLKGCDRRRRVAPVEEVPEPATPAAIDDDPERSLLLHAQIEEVRLANAGLAPRQRLALALRELEDCSYAEIAAIIGINENAVAQLISRARESLRHTLRLAQVDARDLPNDCRRLLPQLSRHRDGQLRGEPLERLLVHLDACGHCQDALEAMGEASRRYRGLLPPLLLTEEAHAAAIDAELTAAGFWESRPTRWTLGRSRSARRSWRRSRRVAVVATAALLLGAGGALVLALPAQHSDRMVSNDRLTASAGVDPASPAGQGTASSGAGGPRGAASSASAPARVDASNSSAPRPHASAGSRSRAGDAAPARTPASARTRESPRPAASVAPGPAAPGVGRAPAANPKTGAPGSRPAGAGAAPSATGPSTDTPTGADAAPGARPGPTADPGPAPGSDPATGPDPTPRRAADTTPPTASITAAVTSAGRARFSFTASEAGATFACALDTGAFEPCTSSQSYSGLRAGRHSFAVRATDGEGNTGPADRHAWTVVEALPDLVITGFTETSVTVANVGSAATDPFVVSIELVGSVTFGGLAAGARATQTFACRSGALTAVADPTNSVAESNEANNRRDFESLC
jgi:RNA polymerase sigma factor (sigma-70 family)